MPPYRLPSPIEGHQLEQFLARVPTAEIRSEHGLNYAYLELESEWLAARDVLADLKYGLSDSVVH